jgi:hypothetical protein
MEKDRTTSASEPSRGSIPHTAREVAIQVMHEMPKATHEDQCVRFDQLMSLNPHCQLDANIRVFGNIVRDLRATRSKANYDVTKGIHIRNLTEIIRSRIVMLNLIMPNGKPMRECLGSEMAAFSRAYSQIAKEVGERLVGDVLSEERVRQLIDKGSH